jgi:N-acetylmuramic acid 6-phosphate etherase
MALNIISTGVMVRLGKVYGNRMVDVAVTNKKLRDRALRILQDLTDLSREEASYLLEQSDRRVKLALLMYWGKVEAVPGENLLAKYDGNLRNALDSLK